MAAYSAAASLEAASLEALVSAVVVVLAVESGVSVAGSVAIVSDASAGCNSLAAEPHFGDDERGPDIDTYPERRGPLEHG